MSRLVTIALLAAACLILPPRPVHATVHEGDLPPDFHKTDLNGASQTLFQYRGKVVVMFLLGYF